MSADVAVSAQSQLDLNNLNVTVDATQIAGQASADSSDVVPIVRAELSAGDLDLTGISASNAPAPSGRGIAQQDWSQKPIDASALHMVNADITLSARSVALLMTTLGQTRVNIALDHGRGVAEIAQMQVFGGQVLGQCAWRFFGACWAVA